MNYFEAAVGTLLVIAILLAGIEMTMWSETKVVMHQMARDAMSVVQVEGCLPANVAAAVSSKKMWGLREARLSGAPACGGSRVPFGEPIDLVLDYTYVARLPIVTSFTSMGVQDQTDNMQVALRSMSQWRPIPAP